MLLPSISFLIAYTLNSDVEVKYLGEYMVVSILISSGYVIVVSLIYWIKEGFQSKDEPTKEDE